MTNVADGWTRCGPNEITKIGGRIRARRRRRIAGGAALLVASACVALAIWFYPRPDQGPDFAGISCEHVMDLTDAYMKHQLAPELQDQVRRHIELCPKCREMFENMPPVSRAHPDDRRGPARSAPPELARHFSPR